MAFRLLIFNSHLGFLLITITLGNTSFKIDSGLLYRSDDKEKTLNPNATIAILNNKKKSGSGYQLKK